jgi:hypothetical protein
LVLSLFIIIVIYLQGGLRLTAGAFFSNWLASMLVTLVAQSFGLLIGATVMEAKTAQTITSVVMLTMMLVRPSVPFGHRPCAPPCMELILKYF